MTFTAHKSEYSILIFALDYLEARYFVVYVTIVTLPKCLIMYYAYF